MKVIAIIGCCQKNSTYRAVRALEEKLCAMGKIEFETGLRLKCKGRTC